MCSDTTRIEAAIHNAAIAPHLWSDALALLAESVGAVGAAYFVSSEHIPQVDWACLSGPSHELTLEFIQHYAAIDPYTPALNAAAFGTWAKLTDCLPNTALNKDEWYNDFVLRSGVRDILGIRLVHQPNAVHLGLHQEIGRSSFFAKSDALLKELFEPLSRAARFHSELRGIGWRSCLDLHALDRLSAGVIVTEADGRLRDLNKMADRILRRGDGLLLRNGQLVTRMHLDSTELIERIAAAGGSGSGARIGRMNVRRTGHSHGYPVTMAPLSVEVTYLDRPMVMLVITDPEDRFLPAGHQSGASEVAAAQTHGDRKSGRWKDQQPDNESGRPGTRYYFDVINGGVFADENGCYCLTSNEAIAQAHVIAKELAVDISWIRFAISVRNEKGNEIARIRIADYA